MGIVEIEGMEFYAYHGHYKEEQIVGNKFIVDLTIIGKCSEAALSDNLEDAVNYQTAYKLTQEEVCMKNSNLLEHLAKRIIDRLYSELTGIEKISVKIRKMNPQMGGKIGSVSVTLTQ